MVGRAAYQQPWIMSRFDDLNRQHAALLTPPVLSPSLPLPLSALPLSALPQSLPRSLPLPSLPLSALPLPQSLSALPQRSRSLPLSTLPLSTLPLPLSDLPPSHETPVTRRLVAERFTRFVAENWVRSLSFASDVSMIEFSPLLQVDDRRVEMSFPAAMKPLVCLNTLLLQ